MVKSGPQSRAEPLQPVKWFMSCLEVPENKTMQESSSEFKSGSTHRVHRRLDSEAGLGLSSAKFIAVEQSCKAKLFIPVFKVHAGFGITAEKTVGVLWAGTWRKTEKKPPWLLIRILYTFQFASPGLIPLHNN